MFSQLLFPMALLSDGSINYGLVLLKSSTYFLVDARCISEQKTPCENVKVVWNPDGSILCVISTDRKCSFVDYRDLAQINTLQLAVDVYDARWSNDGSLFFLAAGDGRLLVYQWPSLEQVTSLIAHCSSMSCLRIDARGR